MEKTWTAKIASVLSVAMTLAGCSRPAASPSGGEVTFTTADNWTIHANFASPPNASKAVILLHQRNGSASDWNPIVSRLNAEGVATLALDLRGAGKSTGPQNGDEAPWDVTPDIDGARKYLDEHGLRRTPIGLIGASYGANNALIYAASHPGVSAVALLSPGEDYHGLKVEAPSRVYHGRILILTASRDDVTGPGPQVIADTAGSAATVKSFDGSAHGTEIFSAHPDSVDALVTFVK